MRVSSSSAYHSLRLASDRRWAGAYRQGRAAAIAAHGLGYGELPAEPGDASHTPPLVELSQRRPPRRREQTMQG
jgi:hypothetical protein